MPSKPKPKRALIIHGVSMRFDAAEWRRIKKAAKQGRMTEAAFVRKAIDDLTEQQRVAAETVASEIAVAQHLAENEG